jgi:L-fuculose-phosphate aldolase
MDPTTTHAQELRVKLALACNILAMEGHSDVSLGHASARDPGAQQYWIKASGLGLEEVTADDLLLMDLEGNKLWGDRRPHNELPIHAEIYRARPDVCAVVHTHPPYATALASTPVPLRPVSNEGVLFVGIPRFTQTTSLILTREQGEALAAALGSHVGVLMKNHGIVTVGAGIEEAALRAIFLEKSARSQALAASFGPYEWTDPEEAASKRGHVFRPRNISTFWDYYCRKLTRCQDSR